MHLRQAQYIVNHTPDNPRAAWEYMTGKHWTSWFTPRTGEVGPDGLTSDERFALRVGREWCNQAKKRVKDSDFEQATTPKRQPLCYQTEPRKSWQLYSHTL